MRNGLAFAFTGDMRYDMCMSFESVYLYGEIELSCAPSIAFLSMFDIRQYPLKRVIICISRY
jgi:hypothetical protein